MFDVRLLILCDEDRLHFFIVKKDTSKANELYQKGCDLDDGLACGNLGSNYAKGNGLNKDISKANALYQKGCNLDDGKACNNLGYNYAKGNGLNIDIS